MFHRGDYKSLAMLVRVYIPDWWHSPVQVCQANQDQSRKIPSKGNLIHDKWTFVMSIGVGFCDWRKIPQFQEIAYMEEFDIVDDVRKLRDTSSDDPIVVIAAERAWTDTASISIPSL